MENKKVILEAYGCTVQIVSAKNAEDGTFKSWYEVYDINNKRIASPIDFLYKAIHIWNNEVEKQKELEKNHGANS